MQGKHKEANNAPHEHSFESLVSFDSFVSSVPNKKTHLPTLFSEGSNSAIL